jgi:lysophospholipase L1-like esterase
MGSDQISTVHSLTGQRFLALGDSYTIGDSVVESERWPNQLVSQLRAEQLDLDLPTIIAQTGWTSGELITEINAAKPIGRFDLVSLLIGVNNQYRGLDQEQYLKELDHLLDMAIQFVGGNPICVVVLSIPDWSVTPFAADRDRIAISKEIDHFNQGKRERTLRHGCQFIDVSQLSRNASQDASLLADDGLHPSGKMYATWCEKVLPAARRALET